MVALSANVRTTDRECARAFLRAPCSCSTLSTATAPEAIRGPTCALWGRELSRWRFAFPGLHRPSYAAPPWPSSRQPTGPGPAAERQPVLSNGAISCPMGLLGVTGSRQKNAERKTDSCKTNGRTVWVLNVNNRNRSPQSLRGVRSKSFRFQVPRYPSGVVPVRDIPLMDRSCNRSQSGGWAPSPQYQLR